MLLVDDLLVKPFVSVLDLLQMMAFREMYDIEALTDQMKENELLYEIGQRSEAEYERERNRIEAELTAARQLEAQISDKFEVKT